MTERRRRRARDFRVETAAALLIPAFVVGIPLLSNATSGSATSGGSVSGALAVPALIKEPFLTTPTTASREDPPLAAGPDWTSWEVLEQASPTATTARARAIPPSATPSTPTPAPTAPAGPSPLRALPGTPTTTSTTSVKPSVPRPPANLVLDFDSPSLVATWDAVPANTDGTPFVGTYEISLTGAGVSKTYTTTWPGFTYTLERNRLDFATPQAELGVSVRAVGVASNRSAALTGVATNELPATPASPPLLVAGGTVITVTATAPAGVEDVAGFDIYHATSPNGPFELLVSTAGTDAFSHAVPAGTTHYYVYKVRDVFGQVSPGFSPMATATTS